LLLIHSTEDFTIQGISYPGIPLLVNEEMEVVEPVLRFIVYQAVQNGRVRSKKTILSYANSLYDFFSFMEANNLNWNQSCRPDESTEITVVALYRSWSVSLTGKASLMASTINTRLAAIRQFYEFCLKRGTINRLPWDGVRRVARHGHQSAMRHTRSSLHTDSTDLRLKTYKQTPKVLTLNQAKQLVQAIDNRTLNLIVKLALTTGMRREELITFQLESICRPSSSQINNRLPVDLISRPNGQRTKGNRARTIYIPAPLMMELYEYTRFGEGVRRTKLADGIEEHLSYLFLNLKGESFSERALNTLLSKLYQSGRIDFHVTPHMLRHTYATMELYAESHTKDMGQALAWVRDRLGHSSIQTTMIYVHCIEQLDDHELHHYQNELLEMANL